MRIWASAFWALCALVPAAAFAQSASTDLATVAGKATSQSQFEALAKRLATTNMDPSDLELVGQTNPGVFVYVLQKYLAERKLISTKPNGSLDSATLNAYLRLCTAEGFEAACRAAPLGPDAIAFTAETIHRDALAKASILPNSEIAGAVVGSPGVLPTNWSENSNGADLASEVTAVGDHSVSIRVHGTTQGPDKFYDIAFCLPPAIPVTPGTELSMSLTSTVTNNGSGKPVVTLRVGQWASDTVYQSELFDGVPLPLTGSSTTVTALGTVSDGIALVQPYIQIRGDTGEAVDIVVQIQAATLNK